MSIKTKIWHCLQILRKKETFRIIPNIDFDYLERKVLEANNKNTSFYKTIVSCTGAGYSGSSAITDLLAEFNKCTAFGGTDVSDRDKSGISYEIDFFRNANGILDLEKYCTTEYSYYITQDYYIRQFLIQALMNYNMQCPFYDDYYLGQTYKFVKKLIDYSIPEKSKLNNATITLKTISKKEFRKLACEYMDEIFKNVNSKEYLVFDQFLTISNPDDELFSDYFKSYKQIFVWSDPRDMYIRGLAHDCQWWLPEDPELFVKFFKRNSEKYFNSNNPNLLIICFDELIHNYEETLVKIMKFLNLTEHEHVKKFEYFNPERSIKNTGLWKNFKNQDAINYIYNNLKDYCWDN